MHVVKVLGLPYTWLDARTLTPYKYTVSFMSLADSKVQLDTQSRQPFVHQRQMFDIEWIHFCTGQLNCLYA